MGAKADFYIGRGPTAEYLGSISYDGYPANAPSALQGVTESTEFRAAVERIILRDRQRLVENGITPREGWPWKWRTSAGTDHVYAFEAGQVWVSHIGAQWLPFCDACSDDACERNTAMLPRDAFPDMLPVA